LNASIIDVKKNNIKNILDAVRFSDSTKKDIAADLGISFATVSNICNELKELDLIIDEDMEMLSVGRTPKIIRFNRNKFITLCFDLHTTQHITIAALNLCSEILFKRKFPFNHLDSLQEFVNYCFTLYSSIKDEICVSGQAILGLAVAVSAKFDINTQRTIFSELPLFENKPLKQMFENAFGLPVYIENESSLSVSAVQSKTGMKNLLYVFPSEGLGVGVTINGHLLTGERGYASEICHIPIGNPEITCRLCGQMGCIESDLCTRGFVTSYLGRIEMTPEEVRVGWNDFLKEMKSGSGRVEKIIEQKGEYLGVLLSVLINLFDPATVYLGGIIPVMFDKIYDPMFKALQARLLAKDIYNIDIRPDNLGEDSVLVGCSEMVYQKFLFSETNYFKQSHKGAQCL